MDVAAACMKAIANTRLDPTWEPELGALFIRAMLAPWSTEFEFCYRTPHGTKSIARINQWRGERYRGSFFDCAKGEMSSTGAGAAVCRRYAQHDDIVALIKLWDDRCTVAEWFAEMVEPSDLRIEDKAMIWQVIGDGKQ